MLTLVSVVFAGLFGRLDAIVLGLGVAMVCYASNLGLGRTLLMASIGTFLAAYLPLGIRSYARIEGFTDQGEEFTDSEEEFEDEEVEKFDEEGMKGDEEEFEDDEHEGFANPEGKKKKKTRRPAPDHGSRAEPFVLGKKYKMPKESDDPEYHLDAGTTFVNAYKQLNPNQISAMTKDTQELINTQKQLMSTLNTLKPLITDGKQIMDTFQNYFGSGGMPNMGDISSMAEKFAPGAK
jgi:hypothetical protein